MSDRNPQAVPVVVLAAGGATRCPGGKVAREFAGRPLVCWLLKTLQESPLISSVVLVCGFQSDSVVSAAEPFEKVQTVINPSWSDGLASSLRTGISTVAKDCPGALVCLADTPLFRPETLQTVVPKDNPDLIVLPIFRDRPGHPKYFPKWLFPELLDLEGDEGARSILQRHKEKTRTVEVDDPGISLDFDIPDDFSLTWPHP
ncbi:MAG: nucleotidyltransferase family protein [Candidatus Eremiobacteraeota bacterium]|nr:nucleotidyltransferase family protein [Candidatus Eremiobacteraeota bacterium]